MTSCLSGVKKEEKIIKQPSIRAYIFLSPSVDFDSSEERLVLASLDRYDQK